MSDSLYDRMNEAEIRLEDGDLRMERIEGNLARNTMATNEILEIVTMGKGFFRVLGYIGKATKWLMVMGAAIGTLYTAWTHRG